MDFERVVETVSRTVSRERELSTHSEWLFQNTDRSWPSSGKQTRETVDTSRENDDTAVGTPAHGGIAFQKKKGALFP